MATPAIPNNLGYTPTGYLVPSGNSTSPVGSQVIMGRNLYATPTAGGMHFDGIGLGNGGRPEPVNRVVINLSNYVAGNKGFSNGTYAFLTMDVNDVLDVLAANPAAPTLMQLQLKEVSVCEMDDDGNTTEKKMIILGSQTYDSVEES